MLEEKFLELIKRLDEEKRLSDKRAKQLYDMILAAEIGTITFKGLIDTPANYTGAGDKYIKINNTEEGVEFGRRLFVSSADPGAGDGEDGDIWFKYTE